MKRSLAIVTATLLSAAGIFTLSQPASAAPAKLTKVTICHRTHAVNNPYRRITVSTKSVDGPLNVSTPSRTSNAGDHAGYLHNGLQKSGANYVPKYPKNPKVFHADATTAFTAFDGSTGPTTFAGYSGANKVWQDIIPPFTTSDGKSYAGLNWNAEGKAIYYSSACGSISAKNFAQHELDSGYYDTSTPAKTTTAKRDIKDDLTDQAADGDPKTIPTDPTTIPQEDERPAGPTPPTDLGSITQAIGGKVWYDDNHNGIQDGSESAAPNVEVDLADPTNSVTGIRPVAFAPAALITPAITACTPSHTGTVWKVCTDASGLFYFDGVPEGLWQVNVVTPSGYVYTYDSADASDGVAPTIVPAGGAGYMWAGLISPANATGWSSPFGTVASSSSGSSSSSSSSSSTSASALANTGQSISLGLPIFAVLAVLSGGLVLLLNRRRRNARR